MESGRMNGKSAVPSSGSFRLRSPSLNSLRLHRIFDLFDSNKDGFISAQDLGHALSRLGLQTDFSDLQSTIASFIKPTNAGLQFDDFATLHRTLDETFLGGNNKECSLDEVEVHEESDLNEAFKVFDENGDGYISAKELQAVLDKLGLPEAKEMRRVEQMIVSVDTNHDGRVDFVEFKNMMRSIIVPSS